MDFNLVVLQGRLAAPPEILEPDSGVRVARYLLAVRSEHPLPRLDVIPVTMWNPPPSMLENAAIAGTRLWVAGTVQRRFWSGDDGRRSRMEILARQVEVPSEAPDAGRPS